MPDSVRSRRRAQIIDAARALVAEEGLEAMTIGALERRLAFSRGVITYHFENKEEILSALLSHTVAAIDAATAAHVSARSTLPQRVHAVIEANVRGFLEHIEATRVLLAFWSRLQSDPEAARQNAGLFATYRARFSRLLRDAPTPLDDPESLATIAVGLVIGIVTQAILAPDVIDVDAAIDAATRALVATIGG